MRLLAFALGGEAGARVSTQLGMPTSPARLLTLIRQTELSVPSAPRVLGVDDWAKRKGCSYGTILVDLETHRPVDLLPDRTAETFTMWLEQHPGVEVISRDRGERYATGGKRGAPAAVHVADRWHLIHNWAEVVERVLQRHHGALRHVQLIKPLPEGASATSLLPPKTSNRRRAYADERRTQAHQLREERWATIRAMHAKGAPLTDIARALHLNYKTVRKYANATECPHMQPYPRRPRLLAPYEPYIRARWAEGCRNGKQLFREIKDHGFTGSRVLVSMFVAQLRRDEGLSLPWLPQVTRQHALTPRMTSTIILRRPADRSAAEQTALEQVRALHPDLGQLIDLSARYTLMIRDRQVDAFDHWVADARQSGLEAVRRFERNLRNDAAAVRAALIYPWSQGQVEGQVHRLKLVKRAMYGRAKFDLLRQRILYRGSTPSQAAGAFTKP